MDNKRHDLDRDVLPADSCTATVGRADGEKVALGQLTEEMSSYEWLRVDHSMSIYIHWGFKNKLDGMPEPTSGILGYVKRFPNGNGICVYQAFRMENGKGVEVGQPRRNITDVKELLLKTFQLCRP